MPLELYPYQREAVNSIPAYFAETGCNPLIVIPTGGGKSLIIGTFIKEALEAYPKTRIVSLVHVPELIEQNFAELMGFWPDAPAGIYSAKLGKRQISSQILFAGIQSIHRRAYNLQRVDIVLIDEAHLIPRTANTMYRRFLGDLMQINPNCKIAGFTATDYRLDSGRLHEGEGAIFDDIAYEVNVRDLIDQGYLCRLISTPAKSQIDMSGVGVTAGEFNQKQQEVKATSPEAVNAIADEILANSDGRKGILAFCGSVKQAQMMRDALIERDISSAAIFGDTPTQERHSIINLFKRQQIRSLASVGTIYTGFNAKHVDMLALCLATKSTGRYVQSVGRGTRLFPGKETCLVLDFGGNIERHGPIDNLIVKSEKKAGDKDPKAPIKFCPKCKAENFISARECADCGYPFPEVEHFVNTQAATLDIMSRNDLLPDWVDVSQVRYDRHDKPGSPPSLRVTYQCGLMQHREWVALEHPGGARARAVSWWKRRAPHGCEVPRTIGEALDWCADLDKPRQIAVRPEGKYTAICGHRYFSRDVVGA